MYFTAVPTQTTNEESKHIMSDEARARLKEANKQAAELKGQVQKIEAAAPGVDDVS